MNRLLVTADLHGSFATWLTLTSLLKKNDGLAVAGDLFDTRYGMYNSPDFQPDTIQKGIRDLKNPFFYVYGNCDVAAYFPGHKENLTFSFQQHSIFMHHGHKSLPQFRENSAIVIQGHTHLAFLEKSNGIIYLNPGSLSFPRNNLFTYGVVDAQGVHLINLKTETTMASINW